MTTATKKPKPGWKTTQAWGCAGVIAWLLTEGMQDPSELVRLGCAVTAGATAIGYAWLRTRTYLNA